MSTELPESLLLRLMSYIKWPVDRSPACHLFIVGYKLRHNLSCTDAGVTRYLSYTEHKRKVKTWEAWERGYNFNMSSQESL